MTLFIIGYGSNGNIDSKHDYSEISQARAARLQAVCGPAEILRQTRARDTNPYLTNATIKMYVSTSINTAVTGCNSKVRMIYGGVYTSLGTAPAPALATPPRAAAALL